MKTGEELYSLVESVLRTKEAITQDMLDPDTKPVAQTWLRDAQNTLDLVYHDTVALRDGFLLHDEIDMVKVAKKSLGIA